MRGDPSQFFAFVLAFVLVPTLLDGNFLFGLPPHLDSVLYYGFLRYVLILHATGTVNSLAHNSSTREPRDSLTVNILSGGEGTHKFHHSHPGDAWQTTANPDSWCSLAAGVLRLLSALGGCCACQEVSSHTRWRPMARRLLPGVPDEAWGRGREHALSSCTDRDRTDYVVYVDDLGRALYTCFVTEGDVLMGLSFLWKRGLLSIEGNFCNFMEDLCLSATMQKRAGIADKALLVLSVQVGLRLRPNLRYSEETELVKPFKSPRCRSIPFSATAMRWPTTTM